MQHIPLSIYLRYMYFVVVVWFVFWPSACRWLKYLKKKKKNLPAVWDTWAKFLGQEDPLEKGMATHSSILA